MTNLFSKTICDHNSIVVWAVKILKCSICSCDFSNRHHVNLLTLFSSYKLMCYFWTNLDSYIRFQKIVIDLPILPNFGIPEFYSSWDIVIDFYRLGHSNFKSYLECIFRNEFHPLISWAQKFLGRCHTSGICVILLIKCLLFQFSV